MVVALVAGCNGGGTLGEPTKTGDDAATSGSTTGLTLTETGLYTDDTDTIPKPTYDCGALPLPPYETVFLEGAIATEDLAFDQEGHLLGSDMQHIWKSTHEGDREIFVANFEFRAGMRTLSTGELVVADNNNGSLVRIGDDGVRHIIIGGLSYPNGLEVGLDDFVYVTEHDANRVRRVDPWTGENTILVDGDIIWPNGITFNVDFTALFIAGFWGDDDNIYRLPMNPDGTAAGPLEVWAEDVGTGLLDGMGVDACGNVYICDYGISKVYRIPPDGIGRETIIDRSATWDYLPNMQWGSGYGGWDPMKLYIPEGWSGKVYEIDLGVPAKPR